ncbi:hypothetical protein Tco_1573020 [Tanacetum coccineum]
MTTLADKAILSGVDNRPPMLEKDMYYSWKSRMKLYMMNRQHERMILESVENGPLLWPTIEENGVTRPRKYSELTPADAIQADCDVTPERKGRDDVVCQWDPSSSPTLDREWHKTKTVDNRPPQLWITQLAQDAGTQSLFNEFLATPIDFFAFIMNRLKIDNLTQEVLTGPTYDLIKGTCKNVVELEYHLEEVFKATNDQLDWHNPEGRSYPHDLSKPLPLSHQLDWHNSE